MITVTGSCYFVFNMLNYVKNAGLFCLSKTGKVTLTLIIAKKNHKQNNNFAIKTKSIIFAMKYSELHRALKKIGCCETGEMRTIKAKIEGNRKSGYNVYIPNNPLPFGMFGEGKTEKEAVENFNSLYAEMKEEYEKQTGAVLEYAFEFSFDLPTMLEHYKGYLSLAGLQRITGINQMQLSQYVNGVRNPSNKTISKIEHSIHSFGVELSKITLL